MFWLRLHLKIAYSTELGASTAYGGHAAATRDPVIAAQIRQVEQDELHHRAAVGEMLRELEIGPLVGLEWLFWIIGSTVAIGCHVWWSWASAFGAAQFEFGGVGDYRRAARAARAVGREDLALRLDHFEAQEAAHRTFFLALAGWYLFGAADAPAPTLASLPPLETEPAA